MSTRRRRHRRAHIPLVLGLLSFIAPSARAEPAPTERTRVLVYALKTGAPELEGVARRLTDRLLVHLGRKSSLAVIGETELELMLSQAEMKIALSEPDCLAADACLTRLSEAAHTEYLVTGRVGRLGKSLLVTLSLTDVRRAAIARGETCLAEGEIELLSELDQAADRLLGMSGSDGSDEQRFVYRPGTGSKIAVVGLDGEDLRPGLAESIAQLVSVEIERRTGIDVITRDEVEAVVDFNVSKQQCLGDGDLGCLLELGGALGADDMVLSRVGRLGPQYVIHLALVRLLGAETSHRVFEVYRGPEQHLPKAVRFAVAALFGEEVTGDGSLEVVTEVPGRLLLNGSAEHGLPLTAALGPLPAGKHALSIFAEDHLTYHGEAYVEPGLLVRFEPELERVPTPWYASWWFWTVVGVAAAGTTAAVLLAADDPNTGRGRLSFE